jgi:hypothetical protein
MFKQNGITVLYIAFLTNWSTAVLIYVKNIYVQQIIYKTTI